MILQNSGASGRSLLHVLRSVLPVTLAAFAPLLLRAQQPPLHIPAPDASAFADGMLDIQLKRDDAAGAVLLLTQDDAPVIAQGFGMADIQHATRMHDQTVVRAGGITAAIIAVAVLQQIDRGTLSLDQDLAPLLDLPLPSGPGPAITLRDLLTHTAGFGGSPIKVPASALRDYLLAKPPPRIFPAGAVHSFSPYGLALAAYAVERVTHQDLPSYVEHEIFEPLGMRHSTLRQPLPPALAAVASRGYGPSTQPPLPEETLAPSLSLSTSAADMGRFGAMLLHHGTLDGHAILSPRSTTLLLSRQAIPGISPELPTMALAFHEIWFNGAHLFGITGDTAAFHSELEIDPAHQLVLFLAYNSSGHPGGRLATFARGEAIHGLFDRYQPFHPTVVNLTPDAREQALATGTWTPAAQLSHSGAPQLHSHLDLAGQALLIDEFVSDRGTVKRWRLIAPNLWQQYPQDRIQAIPAHDGLPDRLVLAADPTTELIRIPPASASTHAPEP